MEDRSAAAALYPQGLIFGSSVLRFLRRRVYHEPMQSMTAHDRRQLERLPRAELARHQLARLQELLAEIAAHNRFYAEKFSQVDGLPLTALEQLEQLPYTFKDELVTAAHPDAFAANLSYPLGSYVRYHQTSGMRGRPMPVLDTAADWQWWIDCWQFILDAAEVGPEDRAVLAFSFGPFIGFWSAHDALVARGGMVVPAGGMNTLARVELIRRTRATTILCTPSYALRLAEVARENRIDPASLEVRRVIVAGEPGGSVAAVRQQIESAWNALVIDHSGALEVGPWGYGDKAGRGLYILETEFIAEFHSLATGAGGRRRRDGGASAHVAGPLWQPGDSLPYGRHCAAAIQRGRRKPLYAAGRRRAGPGGRYVRRARRQYFSELAGADRAVVPRSRGISRDGD